MLLVSPTDVCSVRLCTLSALDYLSFHTDTFISSNDGGLQRADRRVSSRPSFASVPQLLIWRLTETPDAAAICPGQSQEGRRLPPHQRKERHQTWPGYWTLPTLSTSKGDQNIEHDLIMMRQCTGINTHACINFTQYWHGRTPVRHCCARCCTPDLFMWYLENLLCQNPH